MSSFNIKREDMDIDQAVTILGNLVDNAQGRLIDLVRLRSAFETMKEHAGISNNSGVQVDSIQNKNQTIKDT